MARETTITFGQVAQIADTLKASGQKPTSRAIRERIGSGSMGTIHKLLQQWKGKAAPDTEDTDAPEIPSAVIKAMTDWITTAAAEAAEDAGEELADLKEENKALTEENEILENRLEDSRNEARTYREEIGRLGGIVESLKKEIERAEEQRKTLQTKEIEDEKKITRLETIIEMMKEEKKKEPAAKTKAATKTTETKE